MSGAMVFAGLWRVTECPVERPLFVKRICLKDAAAIAGRSESTLRAWCNERGLGRRIGGGTWSVSKVALAMFLDWDVKALRSYHAGDRTGPIVMPYFERVGLGYLLLARKSQPATDNRFLSSSEKEKGDA